MLIKDLVVAYLRAVERFRAAATVLSGPAGQREGERAGWEAMAEALNWADAMDEHLRAHDKPRPKSGDWTDDLPHDSRTLWVGFQHARNAVHHRWWVAQGLRMEMRSGGQVNTLVWTRLPEPGRRPSPAEKAGAEAYATRLGGRPMLETLDELAKVMWPYRGWVISRSELAQPGCVVGTPVQMDPEPNYGNGE